MLDLIRQWLIGLTGAALVIALAESLTPTGGMRKIVRLTGGLVLLLTMVKPVMQLDTSALSKAFTAERLELETYRDTLENENKELMKGIIEEQAGAYIQDKATELGIQCQVEVCTETTGDWPVPETVTVIGVLTAEQQATLTTEIERDFAIPEDRQYYKSGGAS